MSTHAAAEMAAAIPTAKVRVLQRRAQTSVHER